MKVAYAACASGTRRSVPLYTAAATSDEGEQTKKRQRVQRIETRGVDHVVICGGGIQGASIAYYLSLRGVKSTVIERCSVACAASGKAGGFLARNWGAGPTHELHRLSFDLHEQLAEDLALDGYRKLPTLSVVPGERGSRIDNLISKGLLPKWLDGEVSNACLLEDPGLVKRTMGNWETAQTCPFTLTHSLLAAAGSNIVHGKVKGMQKRQQGPAGSDAIVTGVVVDGQVLDAKCVVIAMGPWSCEAEDWFDQLQVPMQGVKSTSVIYKPETKVDGYALFCAEDEHGCNLEVYPRASNDVYLSGLGGNRYLGKELLRTVGPEDISADETRVEAAAQSLARLTSIGKMAPHRMQACLRPLLADGLPSIGAVPGTRNAFIATGEGGRDREARKEGGDTERRRPTV